MRNKKLLFLIIAIMLIVVSFTVIFSACEPKVPVDGGNSGGGETEDPEPEDPIVTKKIGATELFDKIKTGLSVPKKVTHIDLYADIEANGGVYRFDAFINLAETDNQVYLAIKKLGTKTMQAANSAKKPTSINDKDNVRMDSQLKDYNLALADAEEDVEVFGFYVYDGNAFVNLGDGLPVLRLDDFNMDYIFAIAQKALGLVGGAINPNDPIISLIIGLVTDMLFPEKAEVIEENGKTTLTMPIAVNAFLGQINDLLATLNVNGVIDGLLKDLGMKLNVNLSQLVNHIVNAIPKFDIKLKSTFNGDALESLELVVKDNGTGATAGQQLLKIGGGINITDEVDTVVIKPIEEYRSFSFTNLNFDIDLKANNPVGEDGKPIKADIGQIINSFMPAKDANGNALPPLLPENLIMLQIGMGFRLSVAIDLDLNYEKEKVDKNLIAIELFILNSKGEPDGEAALGMYYLDGSAYLNLGKLVPNYYKGANIKIDADLDEIIQTLVKKVMGAIDSGLGLDSDKYFKSTPMNKENNVKIADMFTKAVKNDQVLDLVLAEGETPVISTGAMSFLNTLIDIVINAGAPQDFITFDSNNLNINISNDLLKALGNIVGTTIPFTLPEALGVIELKAHFTKEKPLESISANISVGNVNAEVKIHNMAIGFVNEALRKRVEDGIKSTQSYTDDVVTLLEGILASTRISGQISASIDKGVYDLAPLLAGIGLSFLVAEKDPATGKPTSYKHVPWTISEDFNLDLSLNIQLALHKKTPLDSQFAFELKSEGGIKFGDTGQGGVLVEPNTTLVGIYGYKNTIYVDLSGLKVLNIKMPKLVIPNINFSDLVFGFIGDFKLNLSDTLNGLLAGLGLAKPSTGNEEGDNTPLSEDGGLDLGKINVDSLFERMDGDDSNADKEVNLNDVRLSQLGQILVSINSDSLGVQLSLSAILGMLESMGIAGLDTIKNLNLNLGADISMSRNGGFNMDFVGDIAPRKIDGTVDDWKYGGEHLKFGLHVGTEKFPINIGGASKLDLSQKLGDFEGYQEDLIQAVVDTVGKTQLDLDINLKTMETEFDLQKMINHIMAVYGTNFPVPIKFTMEEGMTNAKLSVRLNLDLKNPINTQLQVAMTYMTSNGPKTMLSLSLYGGSIIVDLRGLGLIQFEIVNSPIIDYVLGMVGDLVAGIGSINIGEEILKLLGNTSLGDIIGGGDKPAIGGKSTKEDIDDGGGGITDSLGEYTDLIEYLLTSLNSTNGIISAKFGIDTVEKIMEKFLGANIGIDIGADLNMDVFKGEIGLNINFDNDALILDVKGKIIGGQDFDLKIDQASVPDWDGSAGKAFAKNMFENLNIGFNIDWKSDSPGSRYWGKGGGSQYTRITIEKMKTARVIPNIAKSVTAPVNSFLITLAFNDEANYNDTSKGVFNPFLYVLFDPLAEGNTSLRIMLCKGWIVAVGFLDIAQYVDIVIPLNMNIIDMFGGIFQGLFDSMTIQETDQPSAADSFVSKSDENEDNAIKDGGKNVKEETHVEKGMRAPSTSFDQLFNGINIIDLLSKKIIENGVVTEHKGISVHLGTSGDLKLGISLNPYLINLLLDDVLQLVFGPNSILALKGTMGFTKDYLKDVVWSRIDQAVFWNTLYDALLTPNQVLWTKDKGLIVDLVYGLIGINIGALSAVVKPVIATIGTIVARLLPLPVISDMDVEINIIDGTIASLNLSAVDKFDVKRDDGKYYAHAIYVDNDDRNEVMKGLVGRGSWGKNYLHFDANRAYQESYNLGGTAGSWQSDGGKKPSVSGSYISLINTSDSVGDPILNNGIAGTITWGISSQMTYDPYLYQNNTVGREALMKNFVGKTIVYQQNTSIYRYNTSSSDIKVAKIEGTPDEVLDYNLNPSDIDLSVAGVYSFKTTAKFNSGRITREKYTTVTIMPASSINKEIVEIKKDDTTAYITTSFKPISMYVYDQMPLYLMLNVVDKDGVVTTRKIATSTLKIEKFAVGFVDNPATTDIDESKKKQDDPSTVDIDESAPWTAEDITTLVGGYAPEGIKAAKHYAQVTLADGVTVLGLEINYNDSTIEAPVSGLVRELDLHDVDVTGLSTGRAPTDHDNNPATPPRIVLTEDEKNAVIDKVLTRSDGNFYYRYVSTDGKGDVSWLKGTWDESLLAIMKKKLFERELTDTRGDEIKMNVTVGEGKLEQTVSFNIILKTKTIDSVSIGGSDVVSVDPYQYYLFLNYQRELNAVKDGSTEYKKFVADIAVLKDTIATNQAILDAGGSDTVKLDAAKKAVADATASLKVAQTNFAEFMAKFDEYNRLYDLINRYNPYPNIVQINYIDNRTVADYVGMKQADYDALTDAQKLEKQAALVGMPIEEYTNLTKEKQDAELAKVMVKQSKYTENVAVVWNEDTAEDREKYAYKNDNEQFIDKTIKLDRTSGSANSKPNSSIDWQQNVKVKVNTNEIMTVYFDENMTKTMLSFNPFIYQSNEKAGIKNFPEKAWVKMVNGSVYELPIAWENSTWAFKPGYEMESLQMRMAIGYDPAQYKYGNATESAVVEDTSLIKGILQWWTVKVFVEDNIAVGVDMDGSALNPGTTFKIDPVAYNYTSKEPSKIIVDGKEVDNRIYRAFPKTVKVKFANGTIGVQNAKWEFKMKDGDNNPSNDANVLDLIENVKGMKNLTATCILSDDIKYEIAVEIIDQTSLEVSTDIFAVEYLESGMIKKAHNLDTEGVQKLIAGRNANSYKVYSQLNIDPYNFKMLSGGGRSYDYIYKDIMQFRVFHDKFEVTIKYSATQGGELLTKKVQTVGLDSVHKTIAEYKAQYGKNISEDGVEFAGGWARLYDNYDLSATWDQTKSSMVTTGLNILYVTVKGEGMENPYTMELRVYFVNNDPIRVGEKDSILYLESGKKNYTDLNDGITLSMNVVFKDDEIKDGVVIKGTSYVLPGRIDMSGIGEGFTAVKESDNTEILGKTEIPLNTKLPVGTILPKDTILAAGTTLNGVLLDVEKKLLNNTELTEEMLVLTKIVVGAEITIRDGYGSSKGYVPVLFDKKEGGKNITFMYDDNGAMIVLIYEEDGLMYYRDIPQNAGDKRGQLVKNVWASFDNGTTYGEMITGDYVEDPDTHERTGNPVTLLRTSLTRNVIIMQFADIEKTCTIRLHVYKA